MLAKPETHYGITHTGQLKARLVGAAPYPAEDASSIGATRARGAGRLLCKNIPFVGIGVPLAGSPMVAKWRTLPDSRVMKTHPIELPAEINFFTLLVIWQ